MIKKITFLFIALMAIPAVLNANPIDKRWAHEKSKTIKKEFDVNSDALLRINNKYGNVETISWDQNRVEIEVTITVSGNNESKVETNKTKDERTRQRLFLLPFINRKKLCSPVALFPNVRFCFGGFS